MLYSVYIQHTFFLLWTVDMTSVRDGPQTSDPPRTGILVCLRQLKNVSAGLVSLFRAVISAGSGGSSPSNAPLKSTDISPGEFRRAENGRSRGSLTEGGDGRDLVCVWGGGGNQSDCWCMSVKQPVCHCLSAMS